MPHPQVVEGDQVEEEHVSYARERGQWYDVMVYGVHKYIHCTSCTSIAQ